MVGGLVIALGCILVAGAGLSGPARSSGVLASVHGLPAKKKCTYVTKKVHGKKKRVKVCRTVKAKATPTATALPTEAPTDTPTATATTSAGAPPQSTATSTATPTDTATSGSMFGGDPHNGAKLWVSTRCVQCHQINGVGGTVAEDLTRKPSMTYDAWKALASNPNQPPGMQYVPGLNLTDQQIRDMSEFAFSSLTPSP